MTSRYRYWQQWNAAWDGVKNLPAKDLPGYWPKLAKRHSADVAHDAKRRNRDKRHGKRTVKLPANQGAKGMSGKIAKLLRWHSAIMKDGKYSLHKKMWRGANHLARGAIAERMRADVAAYKARLVGST